MTEQSRVEDLLASLSLEEKASLTGGDDVWHLPAVDHVGLGRLKVSDGPSGVRGERIGTRRSMSFPCGTAAGATWDVELLGRYGAVLAERGHGQGRPRPARPDRVHPPHAAGRPHLRVLRRGPVAERPPRRRLHLRRAGPGGRLLREALRLQRPGVRADDDQRRGRRAHLREIHLPSFEGAVLDAGVWSVMSAYNRLNGTFCGEHPVLLGSILKQEWGFDGVVISDWFGTHSTVPASVAGLDVEMPGPPHYLGAQAGPCRARPASWTRRCSTTTSGASCVWPTAPGCSTTRPADGEPQDPGGTRASPRWPVSWPSRHRAVAQRRAPPAARRRAASCRHRAQRRPHRARRRGQLHRRAPSRALVRGRAPGPADIGRGRLRAGLQPRSGIPVDRPPTARRRLRASTTSPTPRARASRPTSTPSTTGQFVALGDPVPGVSVQDCSMRATGDAAARRDRYLAAGRGQRRQGPAPARRRGDRGQHRAHAGPVLLRHGQRHQVDRRSSWRPDAPTSSWSRCAARVCPSPASRSRAARPPVTDAMDRAVAAAAAADVAIVVVGSNSQWETEGVGPARPPPRRRAGRADPAGARGQPPHRGGRQRRGTGRDAVGRRRRCGRDAVVSG